MSLPQATSQIIPLLGKFMREYPDIELDLDFTDSVVDVIDEGFDAVIRSGISTDSRLTARQIGTFGHVLVASPEYLKQRGTPLVPADLARHSCLHYRSPQSGKLEVWALRQEEGAGECLLPISMICNNIEARVGFALQGAGIVYLPDFSVRKQRDKGLLIQVLGEYLQSSGVFHILWPASKHPSAKVRALVDFLLARKDAIFPQQER